jgi:hypothetical protein
MTQGAGTEAQRFKSVRARARALRSTHVYGSVYICSVGVEHAAGPSPALALSFSTDDLATMAARGKPEED